MQLPKTSVLTKVNAILSVISTIAYIVGYACPYWLVKEFVLVAVPPVLPVDLMIDINIGLITACKVVTSPAGTEEGCSSDSDGAANWQKVCAMLAIAALVLTVVSCLLSVLSVLVAKCAKAPLLKLITAIVTFIAAGYIIAVLIIIQKNKLLQVYPPLPQQEDFNLGWAYLLSLASAASLVFLGITTVADVIWATCTRNSSK